MKGIDVISPKTLISRVNVVEDLGEDAHSVAKLVYEGNDVLGIRWNGSGDNVGHPSSRGIPTWFVIPTVFEDAVMNSVIDRAKDTIKTELEKIKRRYKPKDPLQNPLDTMIEICQITDEQLTIVDVNLLTEMIRRDDYLKKCEVSLFEFDNEGKGNGNPVAKINGHFVITLLLNNKG